MKRGVLFLAGFLALHASILPPLARKMNERPVALKLGFVPEPIVLEGVSADQRQLVAAGLLTKVLIYFGSTVEQSMLHHVRVPVDHQGMNAMIRGALKLDPYNIDGYYFAQAVLVWDQNRPAEANELLEYGMGYRDWDFYLPLFAGFNSAYFLKDYDKAARFYRRAAELSGADLFKRLAGRYLHEAGQTEHAIAYLQAMVRNERNEAVRETLATRLKALQEVRKVEMASDRFKGKYGHLPESIAQLLTAGELEALPVDPYGGKFYFEEGGKVQTTSRFSFAAGQRSDKQ